VVGRVAPITARINRVVKRIASFILAPALQYVLFVKLGGCFVLRRCLSGFGV
jgi:hypothetical protein